MATHSPANYMNKVPNLTRLTLPNFNFRSSTKIRIKQNEKECPINFLQMTAYFAILPKTIVAAKYREARPHLSYKLSKLFRKD